MLVCQLTITTYICHSQWRAGMGMAATEAMGEHLTLHLPLTINACHDVSHFSLLQSASAGIHLLHLQGSCLYKGLGYRA